jgi:lysophospholipase L1-like esterase
MPRTSHPIPTRLALGLLFAASLLGLAEVGARLSGITPAFRAEATGQWRMTPNLRGHLMQGMREPHNFQVTTNGDGFRTSAPKTGEDGQIRVALMGDSTVFGWGVEDDESIASVAESSLQALGFTNLHVLNMGQPGYSTGMAGWLFKGVVAEYTPDLTIVFISMHDFNRTLLSDVERVYGPQGLSARIRSFLVKHVSLYELLRRKIYPLADRAQLLPNQKTSEARVERVSDKERALVLDQMNAVASQWGGRVAVGFLPFFSDLSEGGATHASTRLGMVQASEWSATTGQTLYDLRHCCGPGAAERTFPFDHGHLNALGNREVGVALAEDLREHLLPQLK